jgi:hypothetical protein
LRSSRFEAFLPFSRLNPEPQSSQKSRKGREVVGSIELDTPGARRLLRTTPEI